MTRQYDLNQWTVQQWQHRLNYIYSEVNQHRMPSDIFGRMVEMISGVARGVRDENQETISQFAPRAFAWMLALASKLNVDLEESVWHWYLGICPHCRNAEGCGCIDKATFIL